MSLAYHDNLFNLNIFTFLNAVFLEMIYLRKECISNWKKFLLLFCLNKMARHAKFTLTRTPKSLLSILLMIILLAIVFGINAGPTGRELPTGISS